MSIARPVVVRALTAGVWRAQPGRVALTALGIAFGVALGLAVHLINSSAANEMNLAVRSLSGEADIVIRGARSGFSDAVYARVARLAGVAAASPAIELEAQVAARRDSIRVLGLDVFRARETQPHLLAESRDALIDLLEKDAVLISESAARALELGAGDTLRVHAGSGVVELAIAGVLPVGATAQRIAVMDIAAAQWRLGRVGELTRIDVRARPGTDLEHLREALRPLLPPGVQASTPAIEAERSASFSRAYRVNLDMLALVALFTGAFLVFSTQFLALMRRRTQLALLRVLGLTRGRMVRLLVAEGVFIGALGSALGLALGIALARLGLERLGGDLGAGYFSAVAPELDLTLPVLATYFALGVAFSAIGAVLPAWEASARPPALGLRAGDEEAALRHVRGAWPGLLLLAAAVPLALAPPVENLPVFGYLSVAALLIGAMLLMPRLSEIVLTRLPRLRHPSIALAAAQLQATPRQAAISLAAIVTSFSLMVSMLIMIGSFRDSLETWLDRMLPADLYVRIGRAGETGYFTLEEQQRIATLAGVGAAVFVRSNNVLLRQDRPPLSLIARPYRSGRPVPPLPVEGREVLPGAGEPPAAWLSEVAAAVVGVRAGDTIEVPLGGSLQRFSVAGLWRDYARQNGAIVIDRDLYAKVTGDTRANEAAIELAPAARFDEVAARVRAVFDEPEAVDIASTSALKATSLAIFDRTFAVTYALEAAAVVIGLFGVSASFGAQALARRREFGVLRHIGMRRRDVAFMLAAEGTLMGSLGVAAGLVLGWLVSLVVIHVINRQSFHWSMDMSLPVSQLAGLAAALIMAAAATAVVSGRRATSLEVTRAVREDW